MITTIEDILTIRAVDRDAVNAEKKRLRDEVRSYRLKELREAKAITQEELAAALSLSQNRISRLELGDIERTQINTLRKYIEGLGGQLIISAKVDDNVIMLT